MPEPVAVDKTKIKIKVLNGSGITGSAARMKNFLEERDFHIYTTGNAIRMDHLVSIIYYKPKKIAEAELLRDNLRNKESVVLEELAEQGQDLILVVGRDNPI